MKKITLIFKGDARVMVYGKEDWEREMERKPECTKIYIGMKNLKNVAYDGADIFEGAINSFWENTADLIFGCIEDGESLIAMTDVEDVELPVTFEVEDFDNDRLMLNRNNKIDFWHADWITILGKHTLDNIHGVMDEKTVSEILAHDELYGDRIDKISNKIG